VDNGVPTHGSGVSIHFIVEADSLQLECQHVTFQECASGKNNKIRGRGSSARDTAAQLDNSTSEDLDVLAGFLGEGESLQLVDKRSNGCRAYLLEFIDHCCEGLRSRSVHSEVLFDGLAKVKCHAVEDGLATPLQVI
jgi:hypothetical protein